MKKSAILVAFLLIVLTATAAFGQNGQQNDKEMLIKASRFLEDKPFDKEAKKIRGWAAAWASETKDVTVIVCGGTASPLLDKKNKFGSELVGQYLISMTAFKLQNPDKISDENAAQTFGLESVLKTYENMLKENPKAKSEAIEGLLAKKTRGELAKYVADADCGKK